LCAFNFPDGVATQLNVLLFFSTAHPHHKGSPSTGTNEKYLQQSYIPAPKPQSLTRFRLSQRQCLVSTHSVAPHLQEASSITIIAVN
jgi:hypothetical protein